MPAEIAIALAAALILATARRRHRGAHPPRRRHPHRARRARRAAHRIARRARTARTGSTRTRRSAPRRSCAGSPAPTRVVVYDASGEHLAHDPSDRATWTTDALAAAGTAAGPRHSPASDASWPSHRAGAMVAQPLLTDDGDALGVLVAVTSRQPGPGMLGAIGEVASYAASQLELADLDASRARLDRAEVLALRAQISPHFIYNALNTIASFVRTDPDRARELILEFADFTRYSFRAAGQYTTLSDELRNIDRYLTLERARFGESLTVRLQVAPEMLDGRRPVPRTATVGGERRPARLRRPGRRAPSRSSRATTEPTASSPSRTTASGWTPNALRSGPADALADATPDGEWPFRARGADQCRPSPARGVRQRLRSGGRDGRGRGHQGHHAGPEVPVGRPGRRRCIRVNRPLMVLAVDDEAPALDELAYLLDEHPDIAEVLRASDATSALRELNRRPIDAVFLDINMPGLSGLELAGVLANFSYRPAVVFVTAHDDKAVEAFDVGAVDYLLKPIRQSRLDEAVRRVLATSADAAPTDDATLDADDDERR